jgi:hypothetical protein
MNRYAEFLCKSSNSSQNETKGTTNNVRFNRRAQTCVYNRFLDCLTNLYELKTLYNVEWYIEISWVGKNFEKKWSGHILWYYSWTDWGKSGRRSELSVCSAQIQTEKARVLNAVFPLHQLRGRALDLLKRRRGNNMRATYTDSCYPVRNPAGTC